MASNGKLGIQKAGYELTRLSILRNSHMQQLMRGYFNTTSLIQLRETEEMFQEGEKSLLHTYLK